MVILGRHRLLPRKSFKLFFFPLKIGQKERMQVDGTNKFALLQAKYIIILSLLMLFSAFSTSFVSFMPFLHFTYVIGTYSSIESILI